MKINLPQIAIVVSIVFFGLNAVVFAVPLQESLQQADDNPLIVEEVAWSPNGTRIAIGSATNYCESDSPDLYAIYVLDAATLEVIQSFQGHECDITSIEWSPDGTRLASSSFLDARVWDAEAGEVISTLTEWICWGESSWSPDSTHLATVLCSEFRFWVWSAETGEVVQMYNNPIRDGITTVDWSPDGRRIASDRNTGVRVWDTEGNVLMELSGHSDQVATVAWNPDGTQLASGSIDGTIHIWDGNTGNLLQTIGGPPPLWHIVWHPSGRALAGAIGNAETTVSYSDFTKHDNIVRIWDTTTGEELAAIETVVGTVTDVDWSPDGSRLVYVGENTGLRGENLQIVPAPEQLVTTPTA